MKNKNKKIIKVVDKYMLKIDNRSNIKFLIFMSVLILVPAASASPIYLDYVQSVYGTNGTSCNTCHISPPALNPYGNAFKNISTHNSDPRSALISLGAPSGVQTDTIPPITKISGVIENGSYEINVTINLTAADDRGGKGVNETIYIINSGTAMIYQAPFIVEMNGSNNVSYWSMDNAGNIETPRMVNFTILNGSDMIPPETNISGVVENVSYTNNVTINLTAADNPGGKGVNETIFIINGGSTTSYSVPFIVDTIGQNNVTYWSTDNAGNIETQKMVNFSITDGSADMIPPETSICGVNENGFYNIYVTICLIATDNPEGTGVDETIFSVNGGSTTTYTAPFIVDTIGQNNVTYWSSDNAGNIETPKMVNFTILNETSLDSIPPITNIWGVVENGLYNTNVTISLTATDNPGGTGIKETIFSVNGGITSTYSAPFVADKIGQNNVTYWSSDNAANVEMPKIINFNIMPSIEAVREINSKSILPGESINITVRINSSINQALSLQEIIPDGWNITGTNEAQDGFKNSTNEWIWFEMIPGVEKIVTYTLKSPQNASIGTYQVNGSIQDENGIMANVEGNNNVKIDMLAYYRRLGNDPVKVENSDLMTAIHDFRNAIATPGFERPLNSEEITELVSEWMQS